MKLFLVQFATALVTMLAIDSVWLSSMVNRFYRPRIGHLMADTPNLGPAVFFYLIYITGLLLLIVGPAVRDEAGLGRVFLMGALYGLVTYATYDLTNHATLRDWPLSVTLVDIPWGALLTGVVAVAAVSASRAVG